MSGHSKWSKIKRQKATGDMKRGQQFTKVGRTITLAVKEGGGIVDPASNFKLRIAIDKAKAINMPKDNIQRAIDRGTGKGGDIEQIEHILYEGYAPYGIALLIETATDNKQRTGAEIKHILERSGGNMGIPGSVAFMFKQQGIIVVNRDSMTDDQMLDKAIECGAEDVEPDSDVFDVYSDRAHLHEVREALEKAGCTIIESELEYRPISTIPLENSQEINKIITLLETLEEHDDVQKVYANADILNS